MYNPININELEQFLGTLEPTQFLIIDVPDVASPTGFTSYKVSPTSLNGISDFTELTDTPSSYIGEAGKHLKVNITEDGLEFSDVEIYDSGFKNIPDYNGTYGLAPIGLPAPANLQIRIIGRTVSIQGLLYFPLSSTADGLTLVSPWSAYDDLPNNTYPYIYKGVNGGYSKGATNGFMSSQSPILPTELCPEKTLVLATCVFARRSLKLTASDRYLMQSYLDSIQLSSSGNLAFSTTESIQGNGDITFGLKGELEVYNSKFLATDFLPDFTNSRSGFAGAVNTRTPIADTIQAGINIDATDGNEIGGFQTLIRATYEIDNSTPMQLIIDAFNSL